MSESKVELNQRKIRNGIRKHKESQQKTIWEKLSTPYIKKIAFDDIIITNVTANTRKLKAGWQITSDGLVQFKNGGFNA